MSEFIQHLQANYSSLRKSEKKIADYLLYEKNIFVTPGFVFGKKGKQYIRISLCVKHDILKKVLARIESIDLSKL